MPDDLFGDILDIRKGGPKLTEGGGPTTVEKITTVDDWRIRADALRKIFRQTLGEQPDVHCPPDLQVESYKDISPDIEFDINTSDNGNVNFVYHHILLNFFMCAGAVVTIPFTSLIPSSFATGMAYATSTCPQQ